MAVVTPTLLNTGPEAMRPYLPGCKVSYKRIQGHGVANGSNSRKSNELECLEWNRTIGVQEV